MAKLVQRPMREIAPLVRRPIETMPDQLYPEVGIRSFGRGVFHKKPKTGSELGEKRLFEWKEGDLLFNIVFAWEGAVAVATQAEDGKVGSHRFLTCVVDPKSADARYLFWWFTHDKGRDQLLRASPGGAGRNRTLGVEKLATIEVPLPPLHEQRRIVRRLDRVAALVDERRSAIEAAERETQALLLKAFQRAIDGAPLRPLAEVAPLVRRPVEIDLDAAYPELGVRSFGRGTFHKPDLLGAELSWQKLFLVQQGDLVFSNIKAWEGAFAVAGPGDHGRVGSHRYLTCVPTEGLATADFIWFYLQTHEGLGKVQAASPGSADRNRTLGQGALEAITVPAPPISHQHWFDRLQAKAREARAIRASTAQDVKALIPAMLHEIFDGGAKAA
ncbi:restriction endonuclease subunit S [Paracoccus angustae]|uniref:Restriction endonuclease subunit S n=1 Tax=Paracoccus angustae TaxID=1671480 RepID=A0ABV7U1R3_9RHOB